MIRSAKGNTSESGFGMVEMVIASGLIILFVLAGSSLQAVYQSIYTNMTRATKARILGLQMVSEMKGHYGRYPYATVGGTPVVYRRCYGRSLELIPVGTEVVRILLDASVSLCGSSYQVDVIPSSTNQRVYLIEVKTWSSRANAYEPAGSYNVAF